MFVGRTMLVTSLLLAVGCGSSGSDASLSEPPSGLEPPSISDIESTREQKDTEFASAPDSPLPAALQEGFEGLEYYEIDPAHQHLVRLERDDDPEPIRIVTTEGEIRPAVRLGWLEFESGGQPARLAVYELRDVGANQWGGLFLPFRDTTSGVETYPAGRYVELLGGAGDWYVLDFNLAYHPLCAYGKAGYRCPRTPEENHLNFAIRAGERGWAKPPAGAEGA